MINAKRGEHVKTCGGAWGRYVGTSAAGIEWVAYPHNDFRGMCAAFDEMVKS